MVDQILTIHQIIQLILIFQTIANLVVHLLLILMMDQMIQLILKLEKMQNLVVDLQQIIMAKKVICIMMNIGIHFVVDYLNIKLKCILNIIMIVIIIFVQIHSE